eukprot:TRINITY_DN8469_c0_g1_i1.p1 TRINITY_DN8469_c0_g1~~TRINITY_DN8469_c0_g1_i1.p1  ORF type:complete len:807 (-),score=70.27 TRINITY_DN8469_c0_g1_i1:106-2526(-)
MEPSKLHEVLPSTDGEHGILFIDVQSSDGVTLKMKPSTTPSMQPEVPTSSDGEHGLTVHRRIGRNESLAETRAQSSDGIPLKLKMKPSMPPSMHHGDNGIPVDRLIGSNEPLPETSVPRSPHCDGIMLTMKESDMLRVGSAVKPTDDNADAVLARLATLSLYELHHVLRQLAQEDPEFVRRMDGVSVPSPAGNRFGIPLRRKPRYSNYGVGIGAEGLDKNAWTESTIIYSIGIDGFDDRRRALEGECDHCARTAEFPAVNYAEYDVTAEAQEGHNLKVGIFVYEFVVHLLYPLSVPLVYVCQGRRGLETHCWAPAGRPHKTVAEYSKKTGSSPTITFLFITIVFCIPQAILLIGLAFVAGGYLPLDSPIIPDLILGFLTLVYGCIVRGFKYGFRARSSRHRLLDHVSRRDEEFVYGWQVMGDEWSIFLIRLAAARCGLDLNATCVFQCQNTNGVDMICLPPSLQRAYDAGLLSFEATFHDVTRSIVRVPVLLVVYDLISNVRVGFKGGRGISEKKLYGRFSYYINKCMPVSFAIVALLPTLVRWQLMQGYDTWSPTWLEISVIIVGWWHMFFGCIWVNMILQSCALVFVRRRLLIDAVAGLVDGRCPGFGEWRLADSTASVRTFEALLKMVFSYDEDFARRAIGGFACLFLFVAASKVSVLIFFLVSNFTGERWNVGNEPVFPAFLLVLPGLFAPSVIFALIEGAKINEDATLRLLSAIDHRKMSLIEMRERLIPIPSATDSERTLDCVKQAFEAMEIHISAQHRPVVLVGWAGRGFLTASRGMVLSYFSEIVLNGVMILQICKFG